MKELNYEKVFNTLVEETKKYLLDNNLKAMILGISGGIDSTVTAAICHEVSKQTDIPLIGRSLPIKNKEGEFNTSTLVGEAFCNNFKICYLEESYNKVLGNIVSFEELVDEFGNPVASRKQTPIANGNIQARLRMIYLYNLAYYYKGLVMSTDNQTEYQLGFWTIHGDVGDFDPLQDLWKTEVYELASYIHDREMDTTAEYLANKYADTAITEEIQLDMAKVMSDSILRCKAIEASMSLTPTDGLGISNSDLEQIGAKSYEEVDKILQDFLAYDDIYSTNSKEFNIKNYLKYNNALYDIEPDVIKKVLDRHLKSEFKRKKAPIYIERNKYE